MPDQLWSPLREMKWLRFVCCFSCQSLIMKHHSRRLQPLLDQHHDLILKLLDKTQLSVKNRAGDTQRIPICPATTEGCTVFGFYLQTSEIYYVTCSIRTRTHLCCHSCAVWGSEVGAGRENISQTQILLKSNFRKWPTGVHYQRPWGSSASVITLELQRAPPVETQWRVDWTHVV